MGICCNGCLVKTRIRNFSPSFVLNFKDGTDLLVDDVQGENADAVELLLSRGCAHGVEGTAYNDKSVINVEF